MTLDPGERIRPGRDYLYLPAAYATAIASAGGLAVYLPRQTGERLHGDAAARALIDRVDALLIPGGDDFLPAGAEEVPPGFTPAAAAQVAFDRALLREALERGMPILGVCYGMQLLALERGGKLVYDIPTERPGRLSHQLPPEGRHAIDIAPQSTLARILGTSADVNSSHHQAVADTGPYLRAVAHAEDGLVEALEAPDHPCVLGVQWHPEQLADTAGARALFEHLVAHAARHAARGGHGCVRESG